MGGKRYREGNRNKETEKSVYMGAEDTYLLADNLQVNNGDLVLDLGTGSGILAILAAKKAENVKVIATDINPYAAKFAKQNIELNKVGKKVTVVRGDLFGPFSMKAKFDLILFNPPYLPVNNSEGDEWIEKAWSGGINGREIIDKFLEKFSDHLKEKGRLLMIQSSLSNYEKTIEILKQKKFKVEIMAKKKFMFEEIVLIAATKGY